MSTTSKKKPKKGITKMSKAIKVLELAMRELIGEMEKCGESGGVGRIQQYAPLLVNLSQAIDILKSLEKPEEEESFAEKMQKAKAAKKLASE